MAITFDGATKIIQMTTIEDYDVQTDLYSPWKKWAALVANSWTQPAFDTTGGDPTGELKSIAPYFFLRNDLGWRIKAPEANGEVVLSGNLFPRDSDLPMILPPDGNYTCLLRLTVSLNAMVIETGVSGLTSEESIQLLALPTVDEVWAYERV